MIFNDLKYRTGCIKCIDNFDVRSIKLTILDTNPTPFDFCKLEIQIMLCGNYYKKLYFRSNVAIKDLYVLKKRLSKKGAIKFIWSIFPKFEPSLVNYGYLPEDDNYYTRVSSLEVYYD